MEPSTLDATHGHAETSDLSGLIKPGYDPRLTNEVSLH